MPYLVVFTVCVTLQQQKQTLLSEPQGKSAATPPFAEGSPLGEGADAGRGPACESVVASTNSAPDKAPPAVGRTLPCTRQGKVGPRTGGVRVGGVARQMGFSGRSRRRSGVEGRWPRRATYPEPASGGESQLRVSRVPTRFRAGPADRWVKVARIGTAAAGRTWRSTASIQNF